MGLHYNSGSPANTSHDPCRDRPHPHRLGGNTHHTGSTLITTISVGRIMACGLNFATNSFPAPLST